MILKPMRVLHAFLQMKRGRLGAAGLVVPLFAGIALTGCIPPDASGGLEVCKSAANGMQGTAFQFTIDSQAPITVNGGSCSPLIQVSSADGRHTITETPAPNTTVANIAVVNGSPYTVNGNSVTVTVNNDGTAQNETRVTYTNAPPGPGFLKVCKQSPDPTLQGSGFSFTENNGPAFSVTAGPVGAPNCDQGTSYQSGTRVNVHELIPTNVQVSQIDVSNGRGSNVNPATGDVTATVGTGTTIVTYTDRPVPVPQTGFIEICKLSGDRFVAGTFSFTVTAPGSTQTVPVSAGQCSGPLQVNAGNVRVDEANLAPFNVSGFAAVPSDRLVSQNPTNQTATVVVPVSADSNEETLVNVTNVTQQGLVKVCKTLTGNAGALANTPFVFNVTDAAGTEQVSIVVGSAPGTQCKFLSTGLPVGSTVTATEVVPPNPNFAPTTPNPVSLTVKKGINALGVTNQALGTVEVCKLGGDASVGTQTFQFSVNDGAPINVKAGQCSAPIVVPAGNAKVAEVNIPANFTFASVAAIHADDQSNALLTGTTVNPATVDVRTGGSPANETRVSFTNTTKVGTFKICKAANAELGTTATFQFTYSYTVNNNTVTNMVSLHQGECSNISANIPVQNAGGTPVTVTVNEAPYPGTQIQSISITGAGAPGSTNTATGSATFNIAAGNTDVTYTNIRTPM
jgi:hypothetical protein